MTTQNPQTPSKLKNKYRYLRLLGEGSNGKTFLAKNLFSGQYVAIKALKLNQSENFKSFELFKREAETLSSLQVVGVPHFYESILSSNIGGECYIIQEYINAPSIQSFLQSGRIFSEQETLVLMKKVTEILNILHSQYSPPVIHRDIKPSNILCDLPTTSDVTAWQTIQPYLIDFGAVANAHSNSDRSTIAGTVGYMAPEQNFGECLPQTDIYALGATALHMLTGVPPYEMDFETFTLKFDDAINEHAPKTSKGMRALLEMMLDYTYTKRPASAYILLDMIHNVSEGRRPQEAAPPPKKSIFSKLKDIYINFQKHYTMDCFLDFTVTNEEMLLFTIGIARTSAIVSPKSISPNLNLNNSDTQSVIQYTFEANGMTWCGVRAYPFPIFKNKFVTFNPYVPISLNHIYTSIKHKSTQITSSTELTLPNKNNFSLPMKCLVVYNINDPSCNKMLYLIGYTSP